MTTLEKCKRCGFYGCQCPVEVPSFTVTEGQMWIGIKFQGMLGIDDFFTATCPCGITQKFGINKFPESDYKHPCDNPDHWTVKYCDIPTFPPSPTPESKTLDDS